MHSLFGAVESPASEMAAYSTACSAALLSTDSSATAYYTTSGSSYVYHFSNYVYGGITLDGTLSYAMDSVTYAMCIDGTLNFTGGDVSSITYSDITTSPIGGTLVIVFSDGSSWAYNYATGAFTSY